MAAPGANHSTIEGTPSRDHQANLEIFRQLHDPLFGVHDVLHVYSRQLQPFKVASSWLPRTHTR